ncbi:MAG: hypothetical protein GY846_19665 [Deltaproteobacteria bacterium]|nr:hypothetical protein [Deltaproteobacteria bacterium]
MIFRRYTLQIILCFGITLCIAGCSDDVDFTPPAGSAEIAITHYSFGKMVIDGRNHDTDLAILPGGKVSYWGFDPGNNHIFSKKFIEDLITDKVTDIIIGTGYNGAASLNTEAKELVEQLKAKGIQVHIMPTSEAVKLFNASSKKGLLACFHLNC